MTWRHYTCQISNKLASILIDARFVPQYPVRELPKLSWFGVYCAMPTGGAFWHDEEAKILDQIEDDLIRLAETFGYGWVVYVLRVATAGIREYYLYHADQAELSKVFTALKAIYPNYRIEFDTTHDTTWEQYRRYIIHKSTNTPFAE